VKETVGGEACRGEPSCSGFSRPRARAAATNTPAGANAAGFSHVAIPRALPYPPPPMHPAYVRSNAAFSDAVGRLSLADEVCIDCEFQGEGRYYPNLCLVQLAFGTECLAVDPHRVDLAPLAPVLASESIQKVLHDGRQDVPILARAVGSTAFRSVFDTQVAAAFAGYGGSIGYGALVRDVCGVELDKSLQVSDWTRELSDKQIEYALDDVRYLSRVASALRTTLTAKDRLAWVLEACADAVRRALTKPDPEKLYRKVSSISRLDAGQLGILREVAKWRDRVAETLDRPVPTVASDLALKSLALEPPRDLRSLEGVRGLGAGRAQPWARELLEAIALGAAKPESVQPAQRDQEALIEGLTAVLGLARRFVAIREGIAAELLVNQAELRALSEWQLAGRPDDCAVGVLGGWRRPVLGELLLEVLAGEVAFRVDPTAPGGTNIVRR
jgi:ribonuclease D